MPWLNSIKTNQPLMSFFVGIVAVLLPIFVIFWLASPYLSKSWSSQSTASLDHLKKIISESSPTITNKVAKPVETVLLVTGDVLLAREVNYQATLKNDFLWPWRQTVSVLQQADITLVNLETPLTADCEATRTGMIFCGDPRNVSGLVWAGVDVISLANNHALNQGADGVHETEQLLQNANLLPVGTTTDLSTNQQLPVIIEKNGIKFAFLAYTDLGVTANKIAKSEPAIITQDIQQAKQLANVVIPFFHWGEEYQSQPTDRQILLAHTAIEAGANLVIGNHPHWYQAVEIYQDVPIIYSHGNFIFDQMWSLETRLGMVGQYTFTDNKLNKVEFLPIKIEDYGQPYFLEGEDKKKELDKLNNISNDLLKSSSIFQLTL